MSARSVLSTLRASVLRRPSPSTALVLAIAALALALRLWDLGARAMHHDESLHAAFSYYLAQGRGYHHDPLMHGPLQFHVLAALFKLFGDGEFTARLWAALCGTALVAAPLLLRRWLGGAGTVVAAALLALSPTLLYYSRFARNDVPFALLTLLIVAAIWRYRDDGRRRWLWLLTVALALAFSTKETVYIAVAALLLYLDAVLALELWRRRAPAGGPLRWRLLAALLPAALWRPLAARLRLGERPRSADLLVITGTFARRWLLLGALLPAAWVVAALWQPLAERLRLGERPRSADLLVITGTLALPFLSALVQIPLGRAGVALDPHAAFRVGPSTVLALLFASAAVGLAWDWRRWLPLAAVFYAIVVPLYTTGFTNLHGIGSGPWGSLDYWLEQQDVRRGEQPGFYYLMLLSIYEFATLLPALVGGAWLLRRGDRFAALLAWWFAATLFALSVAGEKMPWLTVHLALPLALLAALALGRALPVAGRWLWGGRASAAGWAGLGVAAAAGVLVLALSLRTAVGVTFDHPDTPVEPLIYTQSSPEIPRLAAQIAAAADAGPGRARLVIHVDTTAAFSWPWAWYLRRYPQATYQDASAVGVPPDPDALYILADSTLAAYPTLQRSAAVEQAYHHRWWFPEEGYRAASFSSLWARLRDGSLLRDWADFTAHRLPVSRLGTIDGVVLFPPGASPRAP